MSRLRQVTVVGALFSLALMAGCGGEEPAVDGSGGGGAPVTEPDTPEDQLAGRGEVLELEDHRVQIVKASYDPNAPAAALRDDPAPVGFTYLQLLLRFEGIPEDRGVKQPAQTDILQINYPECEEAYQRDWSVVTACLSVLGVPKRTGFRTAQQQLTETVYDDSDVFEPGVPYFATYFFTVVEDLLPTDPELCYVPDIAFAEGDPTEGCIPIGEIES